jgi:hypothetical protein
MKKISLGQTVSVLANVGVLAGLLLVAIQIDQNTDIARAQLENDYYLADMQLELSMMGEAPAKSWIKAVYSPETITREDAAVLDRYFNFGLVQAERLGQMRKLGLAEDELLAKQVKYLEWHLGNEVGRRWWAQYRTDAADRELVRRVDEALKSADFQQNRDFLDTLLPPVGSKQ